jgi:hypothetical protein
LHLIDSDRFSRTRQLYYIEIRVIQLTFYDGRVIIRNKRDLVNEVKNSLEILFRGQIIYSYAYPALELTNILSRRSRETIFRENNY